MEFIKKCNFHKITIFVKLIKKINLSMKTLKYLVLVIAVVVYSCSGNSEKRENGFVVIKTATGKYVCLVTDTVANPGVINKLVGFTTDSTLAERFYMEFTPEGLASFKASNNLYVCADYYKGDFLVADREKHSDWEHFVLEDIGNNQITLKASNGKYVSEDQYIGFQLIANREEAKEWEYFSLEKR